MSKKKVLFLCTGNSCRSQMAEAWTRYLHPDSFEPFSAGVIKSIVDPRAIQVMAEKNIDISTQNSKTIDELPETEFDLIITLCSHARESCPFFPGQAGKLHRGFDDPPSLARDLTPDQALDTYRRVRDEIRDFIQTLPDV